VFFKKERMASVIIRKAGSEFRKQIQLHTRRGKSSVTQIFARLNFIFSEVFINFLFDIIYEYKTLSIGVVGQLHLFNLLPAGCPDCSNELLSIRYLGPML
jgi:hypothetical protein